MKLIRHRTQNTIQKRKLDLAPSEPAKKGKPEGESMLNPSMFSRSLIRSGRREQMIRQRVLSSTLKLNEDAFELLDINWAQQRSEIEEFVNKTQTPSKSLS